MPLLDKTSLEEESSPAATPNVNKLTVNKPLYHCLKCPKVFGKQEQKRQHELTHDISKENRHACISCEKTFSRKHDLTRHIARVHDKKFSFSCTFCLKMFAIEKDWKKHEKWECKQSVTPKKGHATPRVKFGQVKSEEQRHLCIVCNKSYSKRYDLKRHMDRDHIKELSFSCRYCTQLFAVQHDMKRHERRHERQMSQETML